MVVSFLKGMNAGIAVFNAGIAVFNAVFNAGIIWPRPS
jgi:hypothetical protein